MNPPTFTSRCCSDQLHVLLEFGLRFIAAAELVFLFQLGLLAPSARIQWPVCNSTSLSVSLSLALALSLIARYPQACCASIRSWFDSLARSLGSACDQLAFPLLSEWDEKLGWAVRFGLMLIELVVETPSRPIWLSRRHERRGIRDDEPFFVGWPILPRPIFRAMSVLQR